VRYGVGIAANPAGAVTLKRGNSQWLACGLPPPAVRGSPGRAANVIERSAAPRFVVFGAAGELKNHELSRRRWRDASAADL